MQRRSSIKMLLRVRKVQKIVRVLLSILELILAEVIRKMVIFSDQGAQARSFIQIGPTKGSNNSVINKVRTMKVCILCLIEKF